MVFWSVDSLPLETVISSFKKQAHQPSTIHKARGSAEGLCCCKALNPAPIKVVKGAMACVRYIVLYVMKVVNQPIIRGCAGCQLSSDNSSVSGSRNWNKAKCVRTKEI